MEAQHHDPLDFLEAPERFGDKGLTKAAGGADYQNAGAGIEGHWRWQAEWIPTGAQVSSGAYFRHNNAVVAGGEH